MPMECEQGCHEQRMTCLTGLLPSAMRVTCSGKLLVSEWRDTWNGIKFCPHSWANRRLSQLSPGVSHTLLRLVRKINGFFFVQVQIVLFPEVMRLFVIQHYCYKTWLLHLPTLFGNTLLFPLKLIVSRYFSKVSDYVSRQGDSLVEVETDLGKRLMFCSSTREIVDSSGLGNFSILVEYHGRW